MNKTHFHTLVESLVSPAASGLKIEISVFYVESDVFAIAHINVQQTEKRKDLFSYLFCVVYFCVLKMIQ